MCALTATADANERPGGAATSFPLMLSCCRTRTLSERGGVVRVLRNDLVRVQVREAAMVEPRSARRSRCLLLSSRALFDGGRHDRQREHEGERQGRREGRGRSPARAGAATRARPDHVLLRSHLDRACVRPFCRDDLLRARGRARAESCPDKSNEVNCCCCCCCCYKRMCCRGDRADGGSTRRCIKPPRARRRRRRASSERAAAAQSAAPKRAAIPDPRAASRCRPGPCSRWPPTRC